MGVPFDTIIIGAGPGGIFTAYQLVTNNYKGTILVIDKGNSLSNRHCPIGNSTSTCVHCDNCSIMNGFGGAGAFSDGKYMMTTEFGGNLSDYIGIDYCNELMKYVDSINLSFCDKEPSLYNGKDDKLDYECLKNDLHLLNSTIRHLGTDINYEILQNMFNFLQSNGVHFLFNDEVKNVSFTADRKRYLIEDKTGSYECFNCVISAGRSGSKWVKSVCYNLDIKHTSSNVDIGVRVELPYKIFSHITDKVYESKIVYKTKQYQDKIRTFCMNPHGEVVTENTNGIITVNGHSYENPDKWTNNTNFALLVSKNFTDPFNDSNKYGEYIASLSNMLGKGVIVQRFGDLIRGKRSTEDRIKESFLTPTLKATPGDLSLVIPKRLLDDIIEMIYQLDKIAPGTANEDTLLYGVEVKYYNVKVNVDNNLETYPGLYFIGDGSGITHSLSQASASGIYVANKIINNS